MKALIRVMVVASIWLTRGAHMRCACAMIAISLMLPVLDATAQAIPTTIAAAEAEGAAAQRVAQTDFQPALADVSGFQPHVVLVAFDTTTPPRLSVIVPVVHDSLDLAHAVLPASCSLSVAR